MPASVVRMQIVYELLTSKLKITADSRSLPEIANELLSGNGPPPQPAVDQAEAVRLAGVRVAR